MRVTRYNGTANQGATANGLCAVRSSIARVRERAVRSTAAPKAVAELGRWKQYMRPILVTTLFLLLAAISKAEEAKQPTESTMNIHVAMMQSTCKLVGPGSTGTGFIVGKPNSKDPKSLFYTLVTANHVLTGMQGDVAVMVFRRLKNQDEWERIEVPVQIRKDGKDLWAKHKDVDLAAICVPLPKDAVRVVVPQSLLLDDKEIEKYEISPGAELLCLGYPFGAESNSEGFPILRSGKIASYPILPTKKTKTFLFDFTVFRGNSGGPVYLYEKSPVYGGSMHLGSIHGIMGVVTSERNITEQISQLYERRETTTPLALGEVIHASFVRELMDSLPEPQ